MGFMLISTWSDKGGTGKTTVAILASTFFDAGLLDLDPQGDLARWAEIAKRPCQRISGSGASDHLLRAARDRAIWVVDCPPGRDSSSMQGMAYSQIVVIPTRSGDADLVALGRALDTVALVRKEGGNRAIKAAVVLNAIRDTSRARGIAQTLKINSTYIYLGEIKERVAYEEAYSAGSTVLAQEGPAAEETNAVMVKLRDALLGSRKTVTMRHSHGENQNSART
jgi:cellulose biosynthesis protein BcsQ